MRERRDKEMRKFIGLVVMVLIILSVIVFEYKPSPLQRAPFDYLLTEDIKSKILTFPGIEDVFVFIDNGESSYEKSAQRIINPKVSIVLKLSDISTPLSSHEIQQILDVIVDFVPDIGYEKIIITDFELNNYKIGTGRY